MNTFTLKVALAIGAVGLLAGCGSTTKTAEPAVPSIQTAPGQPAMTESLLETLLPVALQEEGITKQAFCASIVGVPDATLTQDFMSGFSATAGSATIDPSIVAPAIHQMCSTSV